MDVHLKRLAEIGLELTAAEEALDEGANQTARAALDRAADGLDALRAAWPTLSAGERTVVGSTAAPFRARLDAARKRLPRLAAVADVPDGERVADPDEDDLGDDAAPPPPAAA